MHRLWGKIAIVSMGLVIAGLAAVWAINSLWPSLMDRRPKLADVPALAPVTRSSRLVMPAAIALTALSEAMERAPRELSGKPEIPSIPLGPTIEINWSVARGAFAVAARPDGLALSTTLNGSLRANSQFGLSGPSGLPVPPGEIPGTPGGFPGPPASFPGFPGGLFGSGRGQPQNQTQQPTASEQRADISGSVVLTARPVLLPQWRLQPNLVAQVAIADASMSAMGTKLNLSNQVKPLLERTINEQVAQLQAFLGSESLLELAARREWAKMCRAISLGAAPGKPNLWLELRPTRAFAAQPRIDQSALTLTFGVEAETRVVPTETKPDCPFPAQLRLVPQLERGEVNVALPIDVPFTELSRLLEVQLKGKSFPEDKSAGFTATIQSVGIAASGDRLLMSLGVKANETKSWFGFGAEAVIHVWGRPALDRSRQRLRIDDIAVDIDSQSAFGLLGLAAKTAVPYLERTLAENAVVDIPPLAANARRGIDTVIAEFQRTADGVRVDAAVTDLRLVSIEFDAKTLRVIAEADGTVRVEVTAFPAR
jgi:hypothetical protein